MVKRAKPARGRGGAAALHGLEPAPIARCRVLELGCSAGANLLPMAATPALRPCSDDALIADADLEDYLNQFAKHALLLR